MKWLGYVAAAVLLGSLSQRAGAQLGAAPLREGSEEPRQLQLGDTSIAWAVIEFENVTNPGFPLRRLDLSFESLEGDKPGDFFRYPMTGEPIDGKTRFLTGIALPPGKYRFTKIGGHVSEAPFLVNLGQADFTIDFPFEVAEPGKHLYLGHFAVQNVETKDNTEQRSGYASPLITQIASGLGGGTLRIRLTDRLDEDEAVLRRRFEALKDAKFERSLIQRGSVRSALGSPRPAWEIRMGGAAPSRAPIAASKEADNAVRHVGPAPGATGFARIDDVGAVPRISERGRDLYKEWLEKPFPRAVAISSVGALARGYGAKAMITAVATCEKFGRACRLYAVDDDVVFAPFPREEHETETPPATNFAPLEAIDAVPRLSAKGKELYQAWLKWPFPRAIAISSTGAFARGFGSGAMSAAVTTCAKFGRPCRLYAVDDLVVFEPFSDEPHAK